MTEKSYYWGGTAVGDATEAPYSDDEFSDIWRYLFLSERELMGPIVGGSELAITNPAGSTVRVASGRAMVDGKFYINDANIDFIVSGATVYWIIGLRKDFAAQTVRAFHRGTYPDRATALASLVQTDGTTWEIALATVLTDGAGAVDTIQDERRFCGSALSGENKIARVTAVGGETNLTIDRLPTIYKHLKLILNGSLQATPSPPELYVSFNLNSPSVNYISIFARLHPSAGVGYEAFNTSTGTRGELGFMLGVGDEANHKDLHIMHVPNYRGNTHKQIISEWGSSFGTSGQDAVGIGHVWWESTDVLSTIQFFGNDPWQVGAALDVYGLH